MSNTIKPKHDIPLSDVMLAMDIADTLRHRDSIVEHELNEEAREEALYEKVKSIYASQGIEVSESTIKEAVQALDEERFAYAPKKNGWFKFWGSLYIHRLGWGIIFTVLFGIWWGVDTVIDNRQSFLANELKETVVEANQSVESLQARLDVLIKEINSAKSPNDSQLKIIFDKQHKIAFEELKLAAGQIDIARSIKVEEDITSDNFKSLTKPIENAIAEQKRPLAKANILLQRTDKSIKGLHQVTLLPLEIANLRDQAVGFSKTVQATKLAQEYYQNAIASLQGLDFVSAQNITSDLKDLNDKLQQKYQLTIVSRQNERTGVWRIPDVNQGARNYYIIVEALNNKGQALTLPIINEENGKTYNVSKWGLRVNKSTFDAIAQDKQDDGIIQNNIFANKYAGYLEPEYRFNTTRKTITKW